MKVSLIKLLSMFAHREWLTSIIALFGITLLFYFFVNYFYKRLRPRLEATYLIWDSALLQALIRPINVLIWVLCLTLSLRLWALHFSYENLLNFLRTFLNFSFIAIVLWFALRFIRNMETGYMRDRKGRKKKYDRTTVRAIFQTSRVVVSLIAILVYLQTNDVNISAVLAFGGAGSLVIGLAAKDLLANFFGGLMIYLDRPFSVGDCIKSPDRDIAGCVEHIGWRLTRIRTFLQRPIYVPNGVFSNISIENSSRMSNRQIKARVGIRYNDASKIEPIQKNIEEMIRNHPDIDTQKMLMVRFDEFGPSSLNLLIHCFTKTIDKAGSLLTQQDIYLKSIKIIENHDAQCAFPTTTLHVPDEITLQHASPQSSTS